MPAGWPLRQHALPLLQHGQCELYLLPASIPLQASPCMLIPPTPTCTTVILCSHERRPFTLAWSRAHGMALAQRCNLRSVETYMRSASNKVGWLVWILR